MDFPVNYWSVFCYVLLVPFNTVNGWVLGAAYITKGVSTSQENHGRVQIAPQNMFLSPLVVVSDRTKKVISGYSSDCGCEVPVSVNVNNKILLLVNYSDYSVLNLCGRTMKKTIKEFPVIGVFAW